MKILVVVFALLIANVIGEDNDKRVVEERPVKPLGGAKDMTCEAMRGKGVTCDPNSGEDELLQVDLPEKYHFLEDFKPRGRVTSCSWRSEFSDQGTYCDQCWAYSIARAISYRACRDNFSKGRKAADRLKIPSALSPYPILCGVYMKLKAFPPAIKNPPALCEPRALVDAFEWVRDNALNFLSEKQELQGRSSSYEDITNLLSKRSDGLELTARSKTSRFSMYEVMTPHEENCQKVLDWVDLRRDTLKSAIRAKSIRAGSGASFMKASIFQRGPIISIIRLPVQFMEFQGSLFNPPKASLRFLTVDNQIAPADQPEDDWYNHFIVVHGWGSESDGTSYWLAENSWGLIYERGTLQPVVTAEDARENKYGMHANVTAFVKLATAVSGRGGLEMTNRPSYAPSSIEYYERSNGVKWRPIIGK